jgi:hypothetical protein
VKCEFHRAYDVVELQRALAEPDDPNGHKRNGSKQEEKIKKAQTEVFDLHCANM